MSKETIQLTSKVTSNLSILVVAICCFRFLFDGIHMVIFGHPFSIDHVDSTSYASILTPVLGAHGYIHTRMASFRGIDNPDEK